MILVNEAGAALAIRRPDSPIPTTVPSTTGAAAGAWCHSRLVKTLHSCTSVFGPPMIASAPANAIGVVGQGIGFMAVAELLETASYTP